MSKFKIVSCNLMRVFLLMLALLSSAVSEAKPLNSEIDNFSPNDIVESSVKVSDGTVIKFRRGSTYSQGHKDTILVASWKVKGETDCCEQELFWEKTDGSDSKPVLISNLIAWRVFYSGISDESSKETSRVHCWKLQRDKKTLTAQKSCPKSNGKEFSKDGLE